MSYVDSFFTTPLMAHPASILLYFLKYYILFKKIIHYWKSSNLTKLLKYITRLKLFPNSNLWLIKKDAIVMKPVWTFSRLIVVFVLDQRENRLLRSFCVESSETNWKEIFSSKFHFFFFSPLQIVALFEKRWKGPFK